MSDTGLTINVTFDSSVANAPAGFVTAFDQAVQFYEDNFNVPITINLQVGWGEINGRTLAPGALGENSPTQTGPYSYAQIQAAMTASALAAGNTTLAASLAGPDPTNGGQFVMTSAEAKALGLADPNAPELDGYIAFNSRPAYTFDPNDQAVPGAYDFLAIAEHEISEVLGRDVNAGQGGTYTPLDLMRYSAPGVHDLTTGSNSYFSPDGGVTNVNVFNGVSGFDPGDWAGYTYDTYDAFMTPGHEYDISPGDIELLDALGYAGVGTDQNAIPVSGTVVGQHGTVMTAANDDTRINGVMGDQLIELGSGSDTVFGGRGDTIVGGNGSYYIDGTAGGVQIFGALAGGSDFILGGSGDTISGIGGDDTIIGAANDTISTGSGPTSVNASAGNQSVTLGTGPDTVFGGTGDTITGGSGAEYIDGSAGHQLITIGTDGGSEFILSGIDDTIVGGAADSTIIGGVGDNIMTDTGASTINAMAGDEQVSLGTGDGTVFGDIGDTISTGASDAVVIGLGAETIDAGSGSNRINVIAGYQLVVLGSGADTVFGGVGDTIVGGSGNEYIDGSVGSMSITVGSAGGADLINSGVNDTIFGGAASATIIGASGDNITTGSGTASINAMMGNETVTLGTGADSVFGGSGDQINTGASNAVVIGLGADTITAGSGTASINALAGNQLVTLGSGNDTVFGGVGDTVVGGSGADYIDGSPGSMSITIGSTGGSDQINSGVNDTISGGAAAATIIGAVGDHISLGSGAAHVNAMAGGESIGLGSGADTVFGGGGDTITAGAGSDYIDMVAGHAGAEFIAAGSNNSLGTDTVCNFSQAAGDRITGETAQQISTIVATQYTDTNGNAVIQLNNGPQVTLVGIQQINASFFQ